MTITSTPSEITYAGDGVSTVFTIPFVFDTSADLKVVETVAGVPTVVTVGFSIAGGAGSTGTLTRSVALPVGTNLLILDNPALTQPVDYVNNDAFPAETHEGALDRLTRMVKRLSERVDRSLRVADGDLIDGDNNLLPISTVRAGKYSAYDAQGRPSVASGTGNDSALRTDLASGTNGANLVALPRTSVGFPAISVKKWIQAHGVIAGTPAEAIFNDLADAVAEGNSLGKDVIFGGAWTRTATLTLPTGTRLRGERGATIKAGANISLITLDGVSDIVLENFKLDGVRGTFTNNNNNGVYMPANGAGCTNVRMTAVAVTSVAGAGIIGLSQVGSHSSKILVEKCPVIDTGAHGIIFQDYNDDVEVKSCDVRNFGMVVADRPGITVGRNALRQKVHHNTVVGSPAAIGTSVHGISLDNTQQAECDHNLVSNCIGYGIEVGGVLDGVVDDNIIGTCGRSGIGISGQEGGSALHSERVVISKNVVEACGTTGDGGIYAFVSGATGALLHKNITFSGNVVLDSPGVGMNLNLIDDVIVEGGNNVRGSGLTGIYLQDCKNMHIGGNTSVGNNTTNTAGHGGVRLVASLLSSDQYVRWGENQVHDNLQAQYTSGTKNTSFAAGDATPSIKRGRLFTTANAAPTTITALDDGVTDDDVVIVFGDANTTVDFTGTTLKGNNGVDKVATLLDSMRCRYDGANWYCQFTDA